MTKTTLSNEDFLNAIVGAGKKSSPEHDKQMVESLKKVLDKLDPNDAKLIKMRFGLDGTNVPKTLEEVSKEFGISTEEVKRKESQILRSFYRVSGK